MLPDLYGTIRAPSDMRPRVSRGMLGLLAIILLFIGPSGWHIAANLGNTAPDTSKHLLKLSVLMRELADMLEPLQI